MSSTAAAKDIQVWPESPPDPGYLYEVSQVCYKVESHACVLVNKSKTKSKHLRKYRGPLTRGIAVSMRNRFLLLIMLFFTGVVPSSALTTISGDIHNQTFDTIGSPYLIVNDIVVPSGTICIIDKGVVFLFKSFTGLTVNGRLTVNGTPDQPVIFTSANNFLYNINSVQPPQPFDWNGIIIAPESYGSTFNHIVLSYSVYGIAAKTPNLSIEKGTFVNNGQFDLTIKDKIQNVKNDAPFSYYSELLQTTPVAKQPPDSSTITTAPPVQKPGNQSSNKWNILRYGLLGAWATGTAGVIAGSVMAYDNKKNIESMGPEQINPDTDTYYRSSDKAVKDEKKLFTRNTAGSIAAGIIGVLGLTGFTLTFFF